MKYKIKIVILSISIFFGISGKSFAGQNRKEIVFNEGMGTISCNKFENFYMSNKKLAQFDLELWISGFVGGLNLGISVDNKYKQINTLKSNQFDQANYLKNYCMSHPLKTLGSAASSLYFNIIDSGGGYP